MHLPSLPPGSAEFAWRACDLREPAAVDALIEEVRPAAVVHLAALAAPAEAERDPLEALRSNYLALDALLGALRRARARRAALVRLDRRDLRSLADRRAAVPRERAGATRERVRRDQGGRRVPRAARGRARRPRRRDRAPLQPHRAGPAAGLRRGGLRAADRAHRARRSRSRVLRVGNLAAGARLQRRARRGRGVRRPALRRCARRGVQHRLGPRLADPRACSTTCWRARARGPRSRSTPRASARSSRTPSRWSATRRGCARSAGRRAHALEDTLDELLEFYRGAA